jgi:integrase
MYRDPLFQAGSNFGGQVTKSSRGLLKSNPTVDWETPEPLTPKRRCYTQDEVATMEAGVRDWLRPVVTALAWSGMRIGELVNLRWKDVDLEKRVLHIRIRDDWKPKGRADRVIPLHSKVEAVIKNQRLGEYVFTGSRGRQIKESFALSSLKKDQGKIGMPEGDLHAFRRFFATTMMQAGTPVETVRQWGGWKSLETMLRYLADVNVKDSVQAMRQAEAKLAAS